MASERTRKQLTDGVGLRVRVAREERGMTLRELASRLAVSPATLSHIETGKTRLSTDRLVAIASALTLPVDELLFNGDQSRPADVVAGTRRGHAETGHATGATSLGDEDGDWRHYEPLALDPVLRAALDAFLESGYHGASVRDISSRCGLSVPGLYHYYSSKQEMLVTLMDHMMCELERRGAAALAEGHDTVSRFANLIENLALFHSNRHELGFVGISERRSLDPANRAKIEDQRGQHQHRVDELVRRGSEEGVFDVERLGATSNAVVSLCTSLAQTWSDASPDTSADIARHYVRLALLMVGAEPQSLETRP